MFLCITAGVTTKRGEKLGDVNEIFKAESCSCRDFMYVVLSMGPSAGFQFDSECSYVFASSRLC